MNEVQVGWLNVPLVVLSWPRKYKGVLEVEELIVGSCIVTFIEMMAFLIEVLLLLLDLFCCCCCERWNKPSLCKTAMFPATIFTGVANLALPKSSHNYTQFTPPIPKAVLAPFSSTDICIQTEKLKIHVPFIETLTLTNIPPQFQPILAIPLTPSQKISFPVTASFLEIILACIFALSYVFVLAAK